MYITALFTWALLATTSAAVTLIPSCLELCNSAHSVNSRPIPCNCAGPVQHIDVSSFYQIGDKGIYYLPVDSSPNQNVIIPLSELKTNASEPNTKIPPKLNLEGLKAYHNNTLSSETKNELNGTNRTKKHKQSEAVKETETTSIKPLNIAIALSTTETSETFPKEAGTDTNYQGKDKYLENCLDIHTLLHSRRTHTTPKLKEKWGDEKFGKYMKLSDAELLTETSEKCSHLRDVIKQSMDEIKQSLPTKPGGKLRVKNIIEHHTYTKVSSINPDMSVQINSTSTGKIIHIDDSGTSTSVVTKQHVSTNKHKNNSFKMVDDNSPPVDWSRGVEGNDTETLKGNLQNVTVISSSVSPTDDVSTVKSVIINKKFNTIAVIKMKDIKKKSNKGSKKYTTDPIPKASIDELKSIATDSSMNGNVTLNNSENIDHNYDITSETSSLATTTEIVDNVAVYTTTVTTCDNCTQRSDMQSSMELAEPKIALPDGASQNNVNAGTPDTLFVVAASIPTTIPTVTVAKPSSDENVSIDTTSPAFETTTEISNPVRHNSNLKRSHTRLVRDGSVTGNIYFNIGHQIIPARFIQDTAGHVNMSINAIALCDKLNLATNGSGLIRIMCQCVQSKSCT